MSLSVHLAAAPSAAAAPVSHPQDCDPMLETASKMLSATLQFREDIQAFYKYYYHKSATDEIVNAICNELSKIEETATDAELEFLSKPKPGVYSRDNIRDLTHLIYYNLIVENMVLDNEPLPMQAPPVLPPLPRVVPPPSSRTPRRDEVDYKGAPQQEWEWESIPFAPSGATGVVDDADLDGLDYEARKKIANEYIDKFDALVDTQVDSDEDTIDAIWREIESQQDDPNFLDDGEMAISLEFLELLTKVRKIAWTAKEKVQAQELFTSLNNSYDRVGPTAQNLRTRLKTRIVLCESLFEHVKYTNAEPDSGPD